MLYKNILTAAVFATTCSINFGAEAPFSRSRHHAANFEFTTQNWRRVQAEQQREAEKERARLNEIANLKRLQQLQVEIGTEGYALKPNATKLRTAKEIFHLEQSTRKTDTSILCKNFKFEEQKALAWSVSTIGLVLVGFLTKSTTLQIAGGITAAGGFIHYCIELEIYKNRRFVEMQNRKKDGATLLDLQTEFGISEWVAKAL